MDKHAVLEEQTSPCEKCGKPSVIVIACTPLCSEHASIGERKKQASLKTPTRTEIIEEGVELLSGEVDHHFTD